MPVFSTQESVQKVKSFLTSMTKDFFRNKTQHKKSVGISCSVQKLTTVIKAQTEQILCFVRSLSKISTKFNFQTEATF